MHNDTTSISVCGDYDYAETTHPDFFITYGLSVKEDGVPVAVDVNSGNTSDKTWNFDYIEKLADHLTPKMLSDTISVADSALVTEPNLMKLKFISRLPGNFTLEKELKEKAWALGRFKELGTFLESKDAASYRATMTYWPAKIMPSL